MVDLVKLKENLKLWVKIEGGWDGEAHALTFIRKAVVVAERHGVRDVEECVSLRISSLRPHWNHNQYVPSLHVT